MYIDKSTVKGKYTRYLLRESYREDGKVKHRTVGNISHCSPETINAIRLALKHKGDLKSLVCAADDVSCRQGLSVGAVWLIQSLAKRLGITQALGSTRQGKLALWQVIARVIDQGSRLSAVRLGGTHAACDILGLQNFNEDDLYRNLDWLHKNQQKIENRLFKKMVKENKKPGLYLYDVTSSYLEGWFNELAAFGYNRDGKRSKKQIVIGLLCNEQGRPISIEVFKGNTQDPKTIPSQLRKLAQRFGGGPITFVGDRGMLKSAQVQSVLQEGFHYITAITRPQIQTLLRNGDIQLGLFDSELAEVTTEKGQRYILRRNPVRAEEIARARYSKFDSLLAKARELNEYLQAHPRAHEEVAVRKVREFCQKLRIDNWVDISVSSRRISVERREEALMECSKLDGCYVLKTDLEATEASKETIHARYKDLSLVEVAFRTSKTVHLEMRPINVRLANRTQAHAFVVMLAYHIVRELRQRWCSFNLTVEEGINELGKFCAMQIQIGRQPAYNKIPDPRPLSKELLEAAGVRLPSVLPCSGIRVATRKKLPERRSRT